MKLADMTLADFSGLLASDAPAPGGGSTAALQGALGAALCGMVAALTAGRPKYEAHQPVMDAVLPQAKALQGQLFDVMERDTAAFNQVSAVFAMPKATDADKAARKAAMQAALKASTITPFEMMEYSLQALQLCQQVAQGFNQNAASDLGVAALSLKTALQGAWLNVLINLGGIEDETFVRRYRSNAQALLAQALPLADGVYARVLEIVGG